VQYLAMETKMSRASTGVLKLNIRNLGSKILTLRMYPMCVHPYSHFDQES